MKYFKIVLITNEKQQGCQGTISDVELSIDGQVEEAHETTIPSKNIKWEGDFDSFDFESAIGQTLLELRENFKASA